MQDTRDTGAVEMGRKAQPSKKPVIAVEECSPRGSDPWTSLSAWWLRRHSQGASSRWKSGRAAACVVVVPPSDPSWMSSRDGMDLVSSKLDGIPRGPGTLVVLSDAHVPPGLPAKGEQTELLSRFGMVLTRTPADARRAIAMGVPPGRVGVCGEAARCAARTTSQSRKPARSVVVLGSSMRDHADAVSLAMSSRGSVAAAVAFEDTCTEMQLLATLAELREGCLVCVCSRATAARAALDAKVPFVLVTDERSEAEAVELMEEIGGASEGCAFVPGSSGPGAVVAAALEAATERGHAMAAIAARRMTSPWDWYRAVFSLAASRDADVYTPLSSQWTPFDTRGDLPGPETPFMDASQEWVGTGMSAAAVAYAATGSVARPVVQGAIGGGADGARAAAVRAVGGVPPVALPWMLAAVDAFPYGAISRSRVVHNDAADFGGSHRSGWPAAMAALCAATSLDGGRGDSGPIIDGFVERTFMWGSSVLREAGVIPYSRPWVGVVHHTSDSGASPNGLDELTRPGGALEESLGTCVGLLALTRDLAAKLRERLDALGEVGARVRVGVVPHPTAPSRVKFSPRAYFERPVVVGVGAWLRDPLAILELDSRPGDRVKPSKAVLVTPSGRDAMADVRELADWLEENVVRPAVECATGGGCGGGCAPVCSGPDLPPADAAMALVEGIRRNARGVESIPALDAPDYDDLLSRSVVFLRLRDASAVNTVLECVARATPVLVNRLPALEELLGRDYPGFYDDPGHAAQLAASVASVSRISSYLSAVDPSKYSFEAFVGGVSRCVDLWTN